LSRGKIFEGTPHPVLSRRGRGEIKEKRF